MPTAATTSPTTAPRPIEHAAGAVRVCDKVERATARRRRGCHCRRQRRARAGARSSARSSGKLNPPAAAAAARRCPRATAPCATRLERTLDLVKVRSPANIRTPAGCSSRCRPRIHPVASAMSCGHMLLHRLHHCLFASSWEYNDARPCCCCCCYIPPRKWGVVNKITDMDSSNQLHQIQKSPALVKVFCRWPMFWLNLVTIGGSILLTDLLEFSLDDLNNLCVIGVRLGNADM